MISIERAFSSISGKNAGEVRQFVHDRISGTDISSFGSGHSSEPSEDIVIQLLRNSELNPDLRKATLEGWMDVYREVRDWLDTIDYISNIEKWKDPVISLCSVVDVAEPPELKKFVKRLIDELVDEEACPKELLEASVRAYMVYAQDEKSVRFWEDEILTNKNVAAYGFNALLEIDPGHARIEEHLCELWRLQVEDNWLVNTAFLLRRAARVRDESALIYRVLLKLKNKDFSLWGKIEKELTLPWTQLWLEKLAEFEQPRHQVFHDHIYTTEMTDINSYYGFEAELENVKSIGCQADKFYFETTMSIDTSTIKQYGVLKRNLMDLSYRTKVTLERYQANPKESKHVSKAKVGQIKYRNQRLRR